jgi:hypothetical protein
MILGRSPSEPAEPAAETRSERATLDDLFRRAVNRRPDAMALVDPPNRTDFTDGSPQRLTYAEADRIVSAIAGRLHQIGLPTDAIIALQLPNTVERVLALLGVLRAGMIAAPLPLLWRRAEAAPALSRLGAKALITTTRIGDTDHGELAMTIAAEVFPIRHVCAFGERVPDGLVAMDDLLRIAPDPMPPLERDLNPAAHVACVTWDVTADGLVPVARNHIALLAGGLAVLLESRMAEDAVIMSALAPGSFADLAATLVPWLLTGGTLLLQQPFDPAAFAAQYRDQRVDSVVLPGPLVPRLVGAGWPDGRGPQSILSVWRAPERVARSPAWRDPSTVMIDVHAFGETALFAARRGADGRPAPIRLGTITAPQDEPGALPVVDIVRSEAGTVALRGPMVPQFPFPPGAERGDAPYFAMGDNGFVDTGYTCRLDRAALVVTGPPPGVVSVGGYRFALRDLQALVAQVEDGSTLAALPDTLGGQRLAGSAADREAMQRALIALGANPLLVAAFRDRRATQQPLEQASAA